MSDIDKAIFDGIKRGSWFQELPDQAIQSLTDICLIKEYAKGKPVYSFGEQRKCVYGILSGCIRVSMTADQEQHYSLIDFHKDSWFGESALLRTQSKVITITPLEDSSFLVLPAREFSLIADQFPHIYKNMYMQKLRSTQFVYSMLSGLLTYPLKARMVMKLMPMLNEHGVPRESGIVLNPSLNLKEWARLSMGSVQRVMLVFDEWVEQGVIVHHQGGWFIPNIDSLKAEIHM